MADIENEVLKAGFRLAAVETILIDLIASTHMSGPDPVKAAEAYRERFRNMLVQNPEPDDRMRQDIPNSSPANGRMPWTCY